MLPELTTEECAAALDAVAAEALARSGERGSPIDAVALATALGLVVATDSRQSGRARMVRLGGRIAAPQPSIMVRPEPRDERLQWAVAHEIGEHLAVEVFRSLGVRPREAPPAIRERIANQLASRILLPRESFAAAAQACDWDLLALKRQFGTASHELIARRMLDFPQPILITIVDNGGTTFRGSNLAGRVPPLYACEQQARQAAHDSNQPQAAGDRRWDVRAWPIHEESWRREILRTAWTVDEEAVEGVY